MGLSAADLTILTDQVFFPSRFRIAAELDRVLAVLKDALEEELRGRELPVSGLDTSRGKIFRGENYRQFPYQLLDFPRRFDSKGVFAFRSLCRWGHEWSFTLHLQGEGLEPFRERLGSGRAALLDHEVWWCVNDTPWEYHFEAGNYLPLGDVSVSEYLQRVQRGNFVKLSRRLELERTEAVTAFGCETFRLFRSVLS
jgi:hypothetical protein